MAFASDATGVGGGPWLSVAWNLDHVLKALHPPLGPLAPEMAEQTEPAVITPAMLEEEEQLEAEGLEKERKMLEEVMPHGPRLSPPSLPPRRSFTSCLAFP